MSMDDPQGSRDSAAQPVGQNLVDYVPVYDARKSPSMIIGFIDVHRCEFLSWSDLSGFAGDAFLCRTPRGVYFELVTWLATLPHTENNVKKLEECAFFVSPRCAAAWFNTDPEEAPEDLRPHVAESYRPPDLPLLSSPGWYLWGEKELPGKLGAAVAMARKTREESQLCPSSRSLLFSARKEGPARSVSTSILKALEAAPGESPIIFPRGRALARFALSNAPRPLLRVRRGRQGYDR